MIRHNPYFNRWFSAILKNGLVAVPVESHNPYFNRWFSAIFLQRNWKIRRSVTILILIDGFLQYRYNLLKTSEYISHNPYFNRWFSAI